MSGGVDSSVAAALLVEAGYHVIGIMLRLWSESGHETDNRCCTPDSMALARRVASALSIPFYALDAKQVHYETAVKTFIDGYAQGFTPNPCIACNYRVRWGFLLDQTISLGASFLATGHYARIRSDNDAPLSLLRAVDLSKDQSYVLYKLNQDQLSHTLFPLGEMTKSEVREKARSLGLPVAERSESQDLCFLSGGDYRDFLARLAPKTKNSGPILDIQGNLLGRHDGLAYYTIGQRKGLKITAAEPLYVIKKDLPLNALIVGTKAELGSTKLFVENVNWIAGSPPETPIRARVKIRYRAEPVWAEIFPMKGHRCEVHFDQPLRDITPGQAAVFYAGEVCLGGGLIMLED